MDLSTHIWLEKTRILVQCCFFSLFLAAFALTLFTLQQSPSSAWRRRMQWFWMTVMGVPPAMWALGTTLEMMRRVAHVSKLWPLIFSIAAFSFLLAGVVVLIREWFGTKGRIDGTRVAWTLALLTFAGWFFGGFSLEWNSLFSLLPTDYEQVRFPQCWILMLCGAQILGAAKTVQSPHEPVRRVLSPKPATWWLLGFALLVAHPRIGNAPLEASAALCGFLPFLLKSWGVRRKFNRRARRVWIFISVLIATIPLFLWASSLAHTVQHALSSWKSIYSLFFFLFILIVWQLVTRFRPALRLALRNRFSGRSLLLGCSVGGMASTLWFGPAGGLFFVFWPLAGLFFDLLRVDVIDSNPLPDVATDAELQTGETD